MVSPLPLAGWFHHPHLMSFVCGNHIFYEWELSRSAPAPSIACWHPRTAFCQRSLFSLLFISRIPVIITYMVHTCYLIEIYSSYISEIFNTSSFILFERGYTLFPDSTWLWDSLMVSKLPNWLHYFSHIFHRYKENLEIETLLNSTLIYTHYSFCPDILSILFPGTFSPRFSHDSYIKPSFACFPTESSGLRAQSKYLGLLANRSQPALRILSDVL